MLVLLIIFMITAPLLTQGIKVDLPKASGEPVTPSKLEPLVLSVDRQGRLYLNVGGTPNTSVTKRCSRPRASAALQRAPERRCW